jgi:hypothetical protein
MVDLKTIAGNWKSYKGVAFNENWRFAGQNVIKGEGFSTNGMDTSFFEKLRIEKVGDSIYYKVSLNEPNKTTDFLLTKASKIMWKFVNPKNDYPSIINYKVENDTLLTVTISNIRGNKKQFFYLEKVN